MSNRNKSDANGGSKGERSNKGSAKGVSGSLTEVYSVPVVTFTMEGMGEMLPGYSCKSCAEPDTEAMVQCDLCHEWHHFLCVGVTEDVENVSWCCPKCATATGVQQTTKTGDQQLPSTSNAKGQQQQKPSSEQVPLEPKLPTNTLRVTTRSAARRQHPAPVPPTAVAAAEHSIAIAPLQKTPNTNDDRQPEKTSSGTNKSHHSQRSLMLQLQKLEEENALQREYIQKKYNILERMSSHSESSGDGGSSRVKSWVRKTNTLLEEGMLQMNHSTSAKCPLPCAEPNLPNLSRHQSASYQSSTRAAPRWTPSHAGLLCDENASSACPSQEVRLPDGQGSPIHPNIVRNMQQRSPMPVSHENRQNRPPFHSESPVHPQASRTAVTRSPVLVTPVHSGQYQPPSSQQLAARQAISKDLPSFSGQPDEWPIFLSTFNNTTAMCGFSDDENIIRLQKCMKGKAYEAVKSLLMHPSNVRRVIDTLRMLFGQPESIVHSMISKINNLPPMKEDKIETIVEYAVNVRNFCATVDACGLEEYLYNISLLHQLVAKLPPSIKLDWARYRLTLPSAKHHRHSARYSRQ